MTDFDDSIFNIRSALDAKATKNRNNSRKCDKYGCSKEGHYRAPKSPGNLREYYYFCLEHIREYNKSWDYFEGCSEDFFHDYMLKDITGHRPTWPMGNIPGTRKDPPKKATDYFRTAFADPFDLGKQFLEMLRLNNRNLHIRKRILVKKKKKQCSMLVSC